ncbi:MAG: hypothetical protein WKF75_10405 [Singulisphaera sp.]
MAEVQRRRCGLRAGFADEPRERGLERLRVSGGLGVALGVIGRAVRAPGAYLGAAVGVGGIQHEAGGRDAELRLRSLCHEEPHVSRHADEVHRDERPPRTGPILDDQGLRKQVQLHTLGGLRACGVARHPHVGVRGDLRTCDAGFPGGRRRGAQAGD